MAGCSTPVYGGTRRDGTEYTWPCGQYVGGDQLLCDGCHEKAVNRYPQGWSSYPGDTCRHGVYVGGCGADYMCGACEFGE